MHTLVPIIKAEAKIQVSDSSEFITVLLDISIDGPSHNGIASAELFKTLQVLLPALGPLSIVLKDYLKSNSLSEAFTGGLPSYGLLCLITLLLIRRLITNAYDTLYFLYVVFVFLNTL